MACVCAEVVLGKALLAGSPGRDTELHSSWRCGHSASGRHASGPPLLTLWLSVMFKDLRFWTLQTCTLSQAHVTLSHPVFSIYHLDGKAIVISHSLHY